MPEQKYDIVIVGAGLAGLAMRRALLDSPWRVLHLHKKPDSMAVDNRGLAMSRSSHCILRHLNAWAPEQAAEIRRIKISLDGQFGSAYISDSDLDGAALGYVVRANAIIENLHRDLPPALDATLNAVQINTDSVQIKAQTASGEISCSGKLLIAADGTNSPTLSLIGQPTQPKPYQHQAIVCELHGAYSEPGLATEHLGSDGPIAVLPLTGNKSKLVYCAPAGICQDIAKLDKKQFMQMLQQNAARMLPEIEDVGLHQLWPLFRQRHNGMNRVLPIGNAAMTVHPNAAQGYNLCLRDIAHLAEHIRDCPDPGATEVLASWKNLRQADRDYVYRMTGLLSSFYNPRILPAPLYAMGLAAMDLLPSVKRRIAWMSMGLGKQQLPDSLYHEYAAS